MNCINHPDMAAVATCNGCGAGLCQSCASAFVPPLCANCAEKEYKHSVMSFNVKFALSIVFSVIVLILCIIANVLDIQHGTYRVANDVLLPIFLIYAYACLPWGWSFFNRIRSNTFLILPIFGWLIYFVIKVALAYFVGLFVAPFQIRKEYKRLTGLRYSLNAIAPQKVYR